MMIQIHISEDGFIKAEMSKTLENKHTAQAARRLAGRPGSRRSGEFSSLLRVQTGPHILP